MGETTMQLEQKTLQQMRYRNLNVIFCVPHKDYIDLIGRVRARSWTHMDDKRRGYSEFMIPDRGKYYSRNEPYWKTQFYYQFAKLPKGVYDRYKEVKIAKSKERLKGYLDEIERKKKKYKDDKPTLDDIVEKVKSLENKNQIKNNRDNYDPDLIRFEFCIPDRLARAVAKKLNQFPSP